MFVASRNIMMIVVVIIVIIITTAMVLMIWRPGEQAPAQVMIMVVFCWRN